MTDATAASSAVLVGPRSSLSYFDCQSVTMTRIMTPLEAWNTIMADPLPGIVWAFRIRDAVSARFGVQRIGGFSGKRVESVRAGDRLDFFLVEAVDADRMVLTARDRHLDVMISVDVAGAVLSITASVVTHNLFGKVYMLPVAPAHRWIVRAMLRRLASRPV